MSVIYAAAKAKALAAAAARLARIDDHPRNSFDLEHDVRSIEKAGGVKRATKSHRFYFFKAEDGFSESATHKDQ